MIINRTPHVVIVARPASDGPSDVPPDVDVTTAAATGMVEVTARLNSGRSVVGMPIHGLSGGQPARWVIIGAWAPGGEDAVRVVREDAVETTLDGIPCRLSATAHVAGLPDPASGSFHIVSGLAHEMAALGGRLDTLCPDTGDAPLTAADGRGILAVRRLLGSAETG